MLHSRASNRRHAHGMAVDVLGGDRLAILARARPTRWAAPSTAPARHRPSSRKDVRPRYGASLVICQPATVAMDGPAMVASVHVQLATARCWVRAAPGHGNPTRVALLAVWYRLSGAALEDARFAHVGCPLRSAPRWAHGARSKRSPSMGRSCINTTPRAHAGHATATHRPANPPPTTQISARAPRWQRRQSSSLPRAVSSSAEPGLQRSTRDRRTSGSPAASR